jgi:hypothetical protein
MDYLLAVTLTGVNIGCLLAGVLTAVQIGVWSAVLLMAVEISCLLVGIFIKIHAGCLMAMYCCWQYRLFTLWLVIDNSTECSVFG